MMTEETLKDNIKLVQQLNSLSVLQFSDKEDFKSECASNYKNI